MFAEKLNALRKYLDENKKIKLIRELQFSAEYPIL